MRGSTGHFGMGVGQEVWIRSTLRIGKVFSSPIEGEAVLTRRPEIELLGVQFPGVTRWRTSKNPFPGREVTSVRWPVGQPPAFSEIEFDLLLKGSLDTDWQSVERELELSFYEQN
jgi:hypothetical protein